MILGWRNRGEALRRKLRSQGGMTLTELLVSMALMALLTVGVGVGVSATGPVMRNSLMLSESQILLDTMVKTISGELRNATKIVLLGADEHPAKAEDETAADFPEGKPFSYSSREFGERTALYNVQKDDGKMQVRVMVDGYGFDLIGNGAFGDLGVQVTKLTHAAADGSFAVTLQVIFPDGMTQDYSFDVHSVLK